MVQNLKPRGGDNTRPPDRPLEVGKTLFEGWIQTVDSDERRAKAADTLMRASMAGKCTRQLFYFIGNEEADEATPADRWRMALGTMVHDKIEADMVPMLLERASDYGWAEVTTEPSFDLTDKGVSCSGHGDLLVVEVDGKRGVVEIKTVNGYKFKTRAFNWDGGPHGPETYHLRQVGLAAEAFDVDWAALLYISMELMSPKELRSSEKSLGIKMEDWDKFMAEWVFDRDTMQPLIDDEMRRMRVVTEAHDAGLPASKIPRVAVVDGPDLGGMLVSITDPETGAWERTSTEGGTIDVGSTWVCRYCPFQRKCLEDGMEDI